MAKNNEDESDVKQYEEKMIANGNLDVGQELNKFNRQTSLHSTTSSAVIDGELN